MYLNELLGVCRRQKPEEVAITRKTKHLRHLRLVYCREPCIIRLAHESPDGCFENERQCTTDPAKYHRPSVKIGEAVILTISESIRTNKLLKDLNVPEFRSKGNL